MRTNLRLVITILLSVAVALYMVPITRDQAIGFVGAPYFFVSSSPPEATQDAKHGTDDPSTDGVAKPPRFRKPDASVPLSVKDQRRLNLMNEASLRQRERLKRAGVFVGAATIGLLALKGGFSSVLGIIKKQPSASRAEGPGILPANSAGTPFPLALQDSLPGGAPAGAIWPRGDISDFEYQDGVTGLVKSFLFQPYVTVSGVGQATLGPNIPQNNGAMFGVDTPDPAGTNGQLPGCNFAAASPMLKTVLVLGNFSQANSLNLTSVHNGISIEFLGGTYADIGTTNGMLYANGVTNIRIAAKNCQFTGPGSAGAMGMKFNNCIGILLDLECTFSQYWRPYYPFLTLLGTTSGVIKGLWQTGESFAVNASSNGPVEISGFSTITGGLTSAMPTNANALILVQPQFGSIASYNIHDIEIDCGGQTPTLGAGRIQVINNVGTPNVLTDLIIDRITVKNGGGSISSKPYSDGIDITGVINGRVSNVWCDHVGDAIAVANSTNIVIANCVATNCKWSGVQVGDPVIQWGTETRILISNCVSQDCGQGGVSLHTSAGFTVISGNQAGVSGSISDVTFDNCYSISTGSGQLVGLLVYIDDITGAHGSITKVTWRGGRLSGYTQNVVFYCNFGPLSQGTYSIYDARGANDAGVVADPFDNTASLIGILTGIADSTASGPTLTTVYTCSPTPVHVEMTESATGTATWQDANGNTKRSFLSNSVSGFDMEVGDTINFATAVPTSIVVATAR